MIASEKAQKGLKAINYVVAIARTVALTGGDMKSIATMLDQTDYLLALYMDSDDESDEFRRILLHLGELFPDSFSHLLSNFDDG